MRTATLCFIIALASCRSQNAASRVTTQDADSLSYADMDPADSADTALAKPRVITGPTVLVFWIAGADTFRADISSTRAAERCSRFRSMPSGCR